MLHFTFQNMRAFYGPWPRGLGLTLIYMVKKNATITRPNSELSAACISSLCAVKHSVWRGRAVAAKYRSFGANSTEEGGEGLWWLKYFYFSFAFFNFIVLQITQYNIYVLYALINVIFMKKNYSLQNLPPPPTLP